jgi:beta-mannanase
MRSVSGASFVFDWNPNIGDAIGNLSAYYPGNSYVGTVGVDVYDMAWKTYPGAQEVWSKYLTEPDGLNWLVSFGSNHNKPLSFPEWGLGTTTSPAGSGNVSGGDDAYFVNQVTSFITNHNFIEAGLWDYKGQFPNSSENPNATAALINDFK